MAGKRSLVPSAHPFGSKCCVLLANLLLIYACVFGLSHQEIDHLEDISDARA